MGRNLVIITIVFALGVGVGSMAFGQRDDSTSQLIPTETAAGRSETSPSQLSEAASSLPPQHRPSPASANVGGQEDAEVIEVEIGPANEAERQMLAIETRWSSLTTRLDRLSRRVIDLERELAERAPGSNDGQDGRAPQAMPIDTSEDRRSALVFAGVDRRTAQDIVSRESKLAMERLDLRDRAAREGWFGSERFVEEMTVLNEQAINLRNEVGDAAFDRFLFETGQSNRVAVSSVLAGSQGELAGILPGDIIEGYAGEPMFDFNDLRSATTAGTRDETVPVTIRRDDRLIDTWMARGPIGVTLQADSADPNW